MLTNYRRTDAGVTSTHLLAGGGGDTLGWWLAGMNPLFAANHNQTCMDTHAANFPHVEHRTADLSNINFRSMPRTIGLWGSPICTEISPSGGKKRAPKQMPGQEALLEYGSVDDSIWEKTRYTAYEILRAVEACGYDFAACENVIEFATDWPLFPWWLQAMEILGYHATVTCVSSAHIGDEDNPQAPQWRDRFYVVFTRHGIPLPDLDPRPAAVCTGCGETVEAVQWWKEPARSNIGGHLIGKYRQQYLYRSPHEKCSRPVVEPFVRPASSAIDFTNVGQRIGDRRRPLAANTVRRIEIGLRKYSTVQTVMTVNHGGDLDPRAYPVHEQPMRTRTKKIGDAIVTPALLITCGGNFADGPMSVDEPMRTRTANPKGFEALVCPPFIAELRNNGTARPVSEPLMTIAAGGTHHALVLPYYTTGVVKTSGDPFDTMTVKDRFAIVSGEGIRVDDCHLRMVQPRESLRGQAFPDWYVVMGNKGEQTAQAGNAVSVNVAKWVGDRILAVLDSRSAA